MSAPSRTQALVPVPCRGAGRPVSQALQLLRAPWLWRRNDGRLWALRLYTALVVLMIGLPALAALVWLPPRAAAIVLAILGAAAALWFWGQQVSALLRLDHPHAARLVPGHAAALRAAAVGLWAVLVAACTAVAAVVLLVAPTPFDAGWRVLAVVMVAAGAALLYVALALRWVGLWVLIWLWPLAGVFRDVRAAERELFAAALAVWQTQPWLHSGLALAAMALALTLPFGAGNSAHRRAFDGRERLRAAFAAGAVGQKPTLAAYGRWGEWLGAPWQWLADAWLARVTARATPRRRSVMARAEVVLHGTQHWVRQVGVLLPLLLVSVASFVVLILSLEVDAVRIVEHGQVGMGIGLVSMVIGPLASLPGVLWTTRREQALLVLLPGMPRGATLNRALAWRQLQHFLLAWALTLPVFVALAWSGRVLQVMALPVAALPMAAWLWRDVAHLRPPRPLTAVWPYLASLMPGLMSLHLLRQRPDLWAPWLAGVLLLTAVLLAWRWQALARMPQALPAGRLA